MLFNVLYLILFGDVFVSRNTSCALSALKKKKKKKKKKKNMWLDDSRGCRWPNEETLKNQDENKKPMTSEDQWMIALVIMFSNVFHALPLPRRDLGGMNTDSLPMAIHVEAKNGPKNGLHRSRVLIRWLMIILVNLWCLSYELLVHVLRNDEKKKPSKIILILSSAYLTLFLRATAGPGLSLMPKPIWGVWWPVETLCSVFAGQRCPGYLRMCGKKILRYLNNRIIECP